MKIIINSIKYNSSLVDGPGIRTVLFMQGCNIHCAGCQNKTTWDINKGKSIEIADLVKDIFNNSINKKITISGGEPLYQKNALIELVNALKKERFDIALYTSYRKRDVPIKVIKCLKYLKTGKFIPKNKTTVTPYVGSTNQKFERL